MKHIALLIAVGSALLGVPVVSAQMISISATPGTQSVPAGGSFTVSLTVSVPQGSGPSNVAGFDLYLVTAAANSGYFSITAATPTGPFNQFGPDDSTPDPLSTDTGTGYVQNSMNQGAIASEGDTQTVPVTNLNLVSLTLSVGASTPAGTYTLQTSTTPTAGAEFSDVTDSNATPYEATSPGMFSITVVPEPATWAMLLGGVGLLGGSRYLRRLRQTETLVSERI